MRNSHLIFGWMAHIALLSVHGVLAPLEDYTFSHEDTGGQLVFLMNLARALAKSEKIKQIDLITRRIAFPRKTEEHSVSTPSCREMKYLCHIEEIEPKVQIIRVGTATPFMAKENLWPILPELTDATLLYYQKRTIPDIWYGHFADGGEIARTLASITQKPFLWSPHSLSLRKTTPNIYRHTAEINCIQESTKVIISLKSTIPLLQDKYFCSLEKIQVSPPGHFSSVSNQNEPYDLDELITKLGIQDLTLLLAAGRGNPSKYFESLLSLFQDNMDLCNHFACLIILNDHENEYVRGIEKKIEEFQLSHRIFLLPPLSHPTFLQLLRSAQKKRAIFLHPSLREAFGLVILEAAKEGIPVLGNRACPNVTLLISTLKCGDAVDFGNSESVRKSIVKVLGNYQQFSDSARENAALFVWDSLLHVIESFPIQNEILSHNSYGRKVRESLGGNERILISDFDGTLSDTTRPSLCTREMIKKLQEFYCSPYGFIISSGRNRKNLEENLLSLGFSLPFCLITSVGTQIWFYDESKQIYQLDHRYYSIASSCWERSKLEEFMSFHYPHLPKQSDECQEELKLSYYINTCSEDLSGIQQGLAEAGIAAQIIFSGGKYLDFIPISASKGNALRYLSFSLLIPMDRFMVAGDSLNDFAMMNGIAPSIVVSNASKPLFSALETVDNVYVCSQPCIQGVMEGVEFWNRQLSLPRCSYCNDGIKHDCKRLCVLSLCSDSYYQYVAPVYECIPLPQFLWEDYCGVSPAMKTLARSDYCSYLYRTDSYFMYPDPKMGPIEELDGNGLNAEGFWFVAWRIHPDFSSVDCLSSHLKKNVQREPAASSQLLSSILKPKHYCHTLCDVMNNEEEMKVMKEFIKLGKEYLKGLFPSCPNIFCVAHFPVSPLYSTFHIHFVCGTYFEQFERKTAEIGRVILLENLPASFDDLKCFICQFHPTKQLLQGNSVTHIVSTYRENGKHLCFLCGTSFSSSIDLHQHETELQHSLDFLPKAL